MLFAIPFLFVVGVALPLMAWSSYQWLRKAEPETSELPSTRALAVQAIAVQAVVFGLASLALPGAGVSVSWRSRLTVGTVLIAVAIALAARVVTGLEARRPLARGDALRRRLRTVRATDPMWVLATIAAAVSEEFAYRGALTQILSEPFGLWGAALVSAVVFGLAHYGQGLRGAVFSAGFGLALQGLVVASGGLLLAIVVHFVYDVWAAALGRRLAASEPQDMADAGSIRSAPPNDEREATIVTLKE